MKSFFFLSVSLFQLLCETAGSILKGLSLANKIADDIISKLRLRFLSLFKTKSVGNTVGCSKLCIKVKIYCLFASYKLS